MQVDVFFQSCECWHLPYVYVCWIAVQGNCHWTAAVQRPQSPSRVGAHLRVSVMFPPLLKCMCTVRCIGGCISHSAPRFRLDNSLWSRCYTSILSDQQSRIKTTLWCKLERT